jgi:hypothetical protein
LNLNGLVLWLKVFAVCANFAKVGNSRIGIFLAPSRQDAKVRKFLASYFASSRPFDVAQGMLCGKYSDSFGCGAAALGKDVITSQDG